MFSLLKNALFQIHKRSLLLLRISRIRPALAPPDLYLPQKKISSYVQNRADLRFLLGQNTENFGKLQKRDQISFTFMHLIIFSSLFLLSEDEKNQKLLVLDIIMSRTAPICAFYSGKTVKISENCRNEIKYLSPSCTRSFFHHFSFFQKMKKIKNCSFWT